MAQVWETRRSPLAVGATEGAHRVERIGRPPGDRGEAEQGEREKEPESHSMKAKAKPTSAGPIRAGRHGAIGADSSRRRRAAQSRAALR